MTKISGFSNDPTLKQTQLSPELPPELTTPINEEPSLLSDVWDQTVDAAFSPIAEALDIGRDIASAQIQTAQKVASAACDLVHQGAEGYTLDPSPAFQRCVEGANKTLEEAFGPSVQLTTSPNAEDIAHSVKMFASDDGRKQLATAAAALGLEVTREFAPVGKFITELPSFELLKTTPTKMLENPAICALMAAANPIGPVALVPLNAAAHAVSNHATGLQNFFAELKENPDQHRQIIASVAQPLDRAIQDMQVGDTFRRTIKPDLSLHAGIAAGIDGKWEIKVERLQQGYQVELTAEMATKLGLGSGAGASAASVDLATGGEATITALVSGEQAPTFIDQLSRGNLSALNNPNPDQLHVQFTDVAPGAKLGLSTNLFGVAGEHALTLKPFHELAHTQKLSFKQMADFQAGNLGPSDQKALKDCIHAMLEPSLGAKATLQCRQALQAEPGGTVLNLELKASVETSSDALHATTFIKIHDAAALAKHLNTSLDQLDQLDPETLLDALQTLPPSALEVGLEIQGVQKFRHISANTPVGSYAAGFERPTTFVKIPGDTHPISNDLQHITNTARQIAFQDLHATPLKV